MEQTEPTPSRPQPIGWFRALTSALDVGVLLLNSNREFDFANASVCALLGCNNPEELDARWKGLQPMLDEVLECSAGAAAAGTQIDVDLPDTPRPRRLRLNLYRLDEDDCKGFLVLVKDRWVLDALDTDIRLATQLRSLARLYVTMAHDLKAPLNTMVINVELLQDTLDSANRRGVRSRQQRYVNVLKEELSRLNHSLHLLLVQAAQPSEGPQQFDLRQLILDLEALLTPQAKLQRIAFTVEVPEHGVMLHGHRDRLKQAILNIAMNAFDAVSQRGEVLVQLQVQHLGARLLIRDSGPGIPPELLPKIGTLHFTTKDTGTGVGLYTARLVVEAYGGNIDVDTELGRGTSFQINLPIPFEEA